MNEKTLLKREGIMAICLAFIGGLLDIFCLVNYSVYATMHTGNVIKVVTSIVDQDYKLFFEALLMIIVFIIGLIIANIYEKKRNKKGIRGYLNISLLFLVIAIFIPMDLGPGELSVIKTLSASLYAFEGAILMHSFTSFGSNSYSSTTMTANLNRTVSTIYDRVALKDKKLNFIIVIYILIFISFILGVLLGYLYLKFIPFPESGFLALYGRNMLILLPILIIIICLLMTNDKRTMN